MKPDAARRLALDALVRVDKEGAYANLLLPTLLSKSRLSTRDRAFATELVYGAVRMRRACDWLVDRFVDRELDVETRNLLRMGAYQLHFLGTPAYAVVSTSVELGGRARRLVEAVLRRVADADPDWPDAATRLSYPDWIVERLRSDLGEDKALAALETMNQAPSVHERPDGYIQDLASQWTSAYVGAEAGERVADLCAAPGGKATALAETGAFVAAGDARPRR
ncbi:MAG: putative rRNA methyltransferase, partial [Acidimicrobiales bacterium]|nr:putative rRNA methyltransferase [Acidimicrobiales bacterium]